MDILNIKNINKKFGDKKILNNFSLKVSEGEIITITGPSGIGKSTLLKCINGIEKIDSGDILICKQSMVEGYNNKKIGKDINKNVGIVFQDFNLFPHLSVMENVTLPMTCVLKYSIEYSKTMAIKLLKKMKLENRENAYPYQLSGGEKQRTAIARTLSINPKLICFDEPTSALDYKLIKEFSIIIKKLAEEKKAILIVTHDLKFAKKNSTKIVEL